MRENFKEKCISFFIWVERSANRQKMLKAGGDVGFQLLAWFGEGFSKVRPLITAGGDLICLGESFGSSVWMHSERNNKHQHSWMVKHSRERARDRGRSWCGNLVISPAPYWMRNFSSGLAGNLQSTANEDLKSTELLCLPIHCQLLSRSHLPSHLTGHGDVQS